MIDLSRAALRRIRLNFFFSFAYNVLCIPVAAGLLYPAFMIRLPPALAGLMMAMSSVSVVVSSLSLKNYRKRDFAKEIREGTLDTKHERFKNNRSYHSKQMTIPLSTFMKIATVWLLLIFALFVWIGVGGTSVNLEQMEEMMHEDEMRKRVGYSYLGNGRFDLSMPSLEITSYNALVLCSGKKKASTFAFVEGNEESFKKAASANSNSPSRALLSIAPVQSKSNQTHVLSDETCEFVSVVSWNGLFMHDKAYNGLEISSSLGNSSEQLRESLKQFRDCNRVALTEDEYRARMGQMQNSDDFVSLTDAGNHLLFDPPQVKASEHSKMFFISGRPVFSVQEYSVFVLHESGEWATFAACGAGACDNAHLHFEVSGLHYVFVALRMKGGKGTPDMRTFLQCSFHVE